jgi:adenosylcobinamide kinase/adenosylcobinamide-phosphate guanylyltransferase
MGQITLITGGARSGKSRHALDLARAAGSRRFFIATGEPLDPEMAARIAHHRTSRGADFETIDAPTDVAAALDSVGARADVAVIDCLTLWISNLMRTERDIESVGRVTNDLVAAMTRATFESIVVTGEVGSGIVPDNAEARAFRDYLGWANQTIAIAANRVILMVAGIAMRVK